MIKDNERFFYRLHVVIDAFVIAFSYLFACFLQLGFFIEKDIGRLTTEEYLLPLFFVVPGVLSLYYAFNLYTSKRVQGRRLEIGSIRKSQFADASDFPVCPDAAPYGRLLPSAGFPVLTDSHAGGGVCFLIRRALVNIREKGHEPQTDSAGGLQQPGSGGEHPPD